MEQIREDIVTACRILSQRRLVEAFGHFSARIPGTRRFVYFTMPQNQIRHAIHQRQGRAPEIQIHSCIYRARPDVGAIARTHSFAASVLALLERSVGVVHDFGAILLGDIAVFPRSELIETKKPGDELAPLRGNGTATVGSDAMHACLRAISLEPPLFSSKRLLKNSIQIPLPLVAAL